MGIRSVAFEPASSPNDGSTAAPRATEGLELADLTGSIRGVPVIPTDVPLALAIIDHNGIVIADRTIRITSRVSFSDEEMLVGTDASNLLSIDISLERSHERGGRFHIRFDAGKAPPVTVLPVLRFLEHIRLDTRLAVVDRSRTVVAEFGIPHDEAPLDSGWIDVVRSLAFVQRASGVEFPIPDELTARDLKRLRSAEALLRGDSVKCRWQDLHVVVTEDVVHQFTLGERYAVEMEQEYTVEVAGHMLPLGLAVHRFSPAVPVAFPVPGEVDLEPGDDNSFTVRLSDPPAPMLDDDLASPIHLDEALLHRAAL